MRVFSRPREPLYSGPVSDHFDGTHFFNPGHPMPLPKGSGLWRIIKWRFSSSKDRTPWPKQVPLPPCEIPPARVSGQRGKGAIRITALGHACFLIQTAGLNILTDPVFSNRASPFSFLGPKRVWPVPFALKQLPKIDIILVSHNHYDHLDLKTLTKLYARDKPRIILPLGNDKLLREHSPSLPSEPYDWHSTVKLSANVKAVLNPVQHWSARGLYDRRQALWTAYTLVTPGGKIFFGGDSGYGGGWWSKPLKKAGPYVVALLPIGAYRPRDFMNYSHMNPAEAVQAKQDIGAPLAIGMHWGTFQLSNEGHNQPLFDLTKALKTAKQPAKSFLTLLPGQYWQCPSIKR